MHPRTIVHWLLLPIATFILAACGGDPSSPDRLQIDPPSATLAFGDEVTLHAQAMTGEQASAAGPAVTWTARDPERVRITANADGSATVKGLMAGATTVLARLDQLTATAAITVGAAPITAIDITPPAPQLAQGTMAPLVATATFADSTTDDITGTATWTSANPGVATVAADGVVRARAVGSTTVTAVQGGVTGTATITVTAAELMTIAVTPTDPSVPEGRTVQLTATGTFTDATTQNLTAMVAWSSADGARVTVTPAGLATGVDAGAAAITATLDGVSGSTTVTVTPATLVSFAITPLAPSLPRGRVQQFVATATYSDASTQDLTAAVTWTSSNAAIATISNAAGQHGRATAVDPGTSLITASFGALSDSTQLTVTPAVLATIEVTPTTPSIADGRTQQFTATGIFTDSTTLDLTGSVAWSSSSPAVATISNAAGSRGRATGAAPGTTTITAASGALTGSTTLTVTAAELVSIGVTPAAPSLARGRTRQFTATGTYSDATTADVTDSVTWSSTAPAIATVSNAAGSRGVATAVAIGATQIRATAGAIAGATDLTVTAAELVSIGVTPAAPALAKGRTRQFTATGVYSDATTDDLTAVVTWSTTAPAVAAISNAAGSRGVATALTVGATDVRATAGAITGSTTLTVTPAELVSIGVTAVASELSVDDTLQLVATGVFSDATTLDLTESVLWASSAPAIATVSNAAGSHGLVTGVGPGTAAITATDGAVVGTLDLTVNDAVLQSLEVTPADGSVAAGRVQAFTATGVFSDGSHRDVTTDVTWSSADLAIATISNAPGSIGVATTQLAGAVEITATSGAITATVTFTVTDAVLDTIAVTPSFDRVALGLELQFTATGTFSDGATLDLTDAVTWATGNQAVATISNAAGSRGRLQPVMVGATMVTAEQGGVSGSTFVTVMPAALVSLAVEPATASIPAGQQLAFTATGTFSDGSTQVLTDQVLWTSSDAQIATVSNAFGSMGVATGVGGGVATITATSGAVGAGAELTVIPPILESIEVTPAGGTVVAGFTQAFTATGHYDNGQSFDLTSQVTWLSSDPLIATISNAPGSNGLATGRSLGDVVITATLDGVFGTTDLHVDAAVVLGVTVTPAGPTLARGRAAPYLAEASMSDGSVVDVTEQAVWSSADETVAVVANTAGVRGRVTALELGVTTITATYDGVSGDAGLEVTAAVLDEIAIAPLDAPPLTVGEGRDYTATGRYSDLTEVDLTAQVLWETSAPGVVEISSAAGSEGHVTALAIGTATLSATLDGVTATHLVEVVAAPAP